MIQRALSFPGIAEKSEGLATQTPSWLWLIFHGLTLTRHSSSSTFPPSSCARSGFPFYCCVNTLVAALHRCLVTKFFPRIVFPVFYTWKTFPVEFSSVWSLSERIKAKIWHLPCLLFLLFILNTPFISTNRRHKKCLSPTACHPFLISSSLRCSTIKKKNLFYFLNRFQGGLLQSKCKSGIPRYTLEAFPFHCMPW